MTAGAPEIYSQTTFTRPCGDVSLRQSRGSSGLLRSNGALTVCIFHPLPGIALA